MGDRDHGRHLVQGLKAGESGGKTGFSARRFELSRQLKEYRRNLGPMPKRCIEAMADLGLSDLEIARYHTIPKNCVSELRRIWNIEGTA